MYPFLPLHTRQWDVMSKLSFEDEFQLNPFIEQCCLVIWWSGSDCLPQQQDLSSIPGSNPWRVTVSVVSPRCFDSPTISPMDVKISYTNSSVPSFERILVESTINASMFRSTGTVCCEASSNGDRSSAFFNFAIKGNRWSERDHKTWVLFSSFCKRILSGLPLP